MLMLSRLAAQSDRATLTGTVADPTHAGIPGAKIAIRAVATGVEQTTITSAAGVYTLGFLPLGEYTATVTANGFETLRVEPFRLDAGQTRTLNLTMRLGTLSSEVIVTSAAPDLDQAT